MKFNRVRKPMAVVGIITMFFGTLLVVAPPSGASHTPGPSPTVVDGNQSCANGEQEFKFDSPFNVDGDSDTRNITFGPGDTRSVTIAYTGYLVDGVRHYDFTVTGTNVGVSTGIVKQGNDSAIFTFDPPVTSGTIYVALLAGTNASPAGTSHVTFCLEDTPPPPTTTPPTTTPPTTTPPTTTPPTTTEAPEETTTTTEVDELDDGAVNTSTTSTPAGTVRTLSNPTPGPEVQGQTVTRTLPRTGAAADTLSLAGFVLVLLGAALIMGSRRSTLRTDTAYSAKHLL